MTPDEELLVAQVVSAHRERRADGSIVGAPAFYDLDAAGRVAAFEETEQQRALEAALHPQGLSTTVLAVLGRLESS
jgi:hypothetical protein